MSFYSILYYFGLYYFGIYYFSMYYFDCYACFNFLYNIVLLLSFFFLPILQTFDIFLLFPSTLPGCFTILQQSYFTFPEYSSVIYIFPQPKYFFFYIQLFYRWFPSGYFLFRKTFSSLVSRFLNIQNSYCLFFYKNNI